MKPLDSYKCNRSLKFSISCYESITNRKLLDSEKHLFEVGFLIGIISQRRWNIEEAIAILKNDLSKKIWLKTHAERK